MDKKKNRMLEIQDKDNYFFKICDDWKANDEQINAFHNLRLKIKCHLSPNNKKQLILPFK